MHVDDCYDRVKIIDGSLRVPDVRMAARLKLIELVRKVHDALHIRRRAAVSFEQTHCGDNRRQFQGPFLSYQYNYITRAEEL